MLKVWGKISNGTGILYGDKMLISEHGKVFTFCQEKNVLCRDVLVKHGSVDQVLGFTAYDSIEACGFYGFGGDPIETLVALIHDRLTVTRHYLTVHRAAYMWVDGSPSGLSYIWRGPINFFSPREAPVDLQKEAMDDLKAPRRSLAEPEHHRIEMVNLANSFNLFLMVWLKREISSRKQHTEVAGC